MLREPNIEAIDSWPTSETELRSFLGLAGYYRRMVPGFSKIAAPLKALLGGIKTKKKNSRRKKILDSSASTFVHFVNRCINFRSFRKPIVCGLSSIVRVVEEELCRL